MALTELAAPTTQNGPMGMLQPLPPQLGLGNLRDRLIKHRDIIGNGFYNNPPPLMSIDGQLPQLPIRPPGFGISPMPDYRGRPGPAMPDYSGQFEKFGEQLGGFGEQLTGYQDALGSFNEQVGGMGKQFETISNRLDSVDKGLGSLGNQIASLENMQKAQPQQVMQPRQPMYSPFGFGLGALFGRRF